MDPERRARWQKLKNIFNDTLEQDREEWPAFLLEQCGDDVDLFLEVSSLLAVEAQIGGFIETPAVDSVFPVQVESPEVKR